MSQGRVWTSVSPASGTESVFRVVGFCEEESTPAQTSTIDLDGISVQDYGRAILEQEGQAILQQSQSLNAETFFQAVSLLVHCTGNVIVTGIGKAGLVGRKIAATLSSTGTSSHFVHPAEAIHGDLGEIRAGDMIIILSHSGETEEITRLLPLLRTMNIPILAITSNHLNTLARYSSAVISLGELEEAGFLKLAPSTSTTVMLAWGDALALTVSRMRGFTADDFARYHPGGSLGKRLSTVDDYMRPVSRCRICSDRRTVRDIFVDSRLPGRRSGAILLVDDQGKLSGIFTDSDLARIFEKRLFNLLDQPVNNIMTCSPKVVQSGTKMQIAVDFMGNMKISELPVLDQFNVPVGILDITDLVSFFPEEKNTNL